MRQISCCYSFERYVYIFFLFGAALNFLPQILGFSLIDSTTDEYPDFLKKLSGFQYGASVVASLTTTLPILLDYFFDAVLSFSEKMFHPSHQKDTPAEAKMNYIPFREVVFLLVIPDLVNLVWIIPYEQYDYLPGLIGVRDTMYIYTFLVCMVRFQNPIWNWTTTILIGFPFLAANILGSCQVLSVDPTFLKASLVILPFLVASGLFALMVTIVRWFVYINGLDLKVITAEESRKLLMCSIYALCYTIFLLGDWLIFFAPQPLDPDWSNVGTNYLTMYTYLMAGCTLVITVITSRFARLEAEDSKSILSLKQMFMRYISHEIRTPLNTLFLGLKILQDDIQPTATEDTKAVLKDTQESCSTAIEILNEMLLYDKIVGGLMTLEKSELGPNDFISKTLSPFRSQAREAGVVMNFITSITAAHSDLRLNADPFKLAQIVRNLISNALKFTPQNGTVDVTLAVESNRTAVVDVPTAASIVTSNSSFLPQIVSRAWGTFLSWLFTSDGRKYAAVADVAHWMVLTVKDSGAGISKENQAKLFHGIIQFNPGKLQKGGGTGLGLFISKQIADLHGGSLTVNSSGEGDGCTFTLRLPLSYKNTSQQMDVEAPLMKDDNDERGQEVLGALFKPRQTFLLKDSVIPVTEGNINVGPSLVVNSAHMAPEKIFDEKIDDVEEIQKKLKILVVDDSNMNRRMICKTLNGKDSVCDQAEDGAIAVEMMKERMRAAQSGGDRGLFDVVMMDYQMPNMDGPTAIKAIRQLGYRGVIVGLTGNAMQSDRDTLLNAGADDVFAKPLDVNLFWESVRKKNVGCEV